jgi:hypothetical protein
MVTSKQELIEAIEKIGYIKMEDRIQYIPDLSILSLMENRGLKGDRLALNFIFQNDKGISIIRHEGSYGGYDGLFEIGVTDENGHLIYDTEITDDVIGHLELEEVLEIINKIKKL